MIKIRKKNEIFFIDGNWFKAYWHFSFDRYYDLDNMQFGKLRVFNVDTLIPGAVWPMHPHTEMEVVTYCTDGEFKHADNLGNNGVLLPGDVQHTTIGSGMLHSEINNSKTKPMAFIQIWILPKTKGLAPSVEQKHVKKEERLDKFLPVVSNQHKDALPIEQDAEVFVSTLQTGKKLAHNFESGFGGYFYVISGEVKLNKHSLSEGDAAKISNEKSIDIEAIKESHLLMVVVKI